MTTALLSRIAEEAEEARQAAWERRRIGEKRKPKWACDHLLDGGYITAEQHSAAARYISLLERSQPGGGHAGDKVDGSRGDIHARLWDCAVSASIARAARSWVLNTATAHRKRMNVMDLLFRFPLPNMTKMTYTPRGGKLPYHYAVSRITAVLDMLVIFFAQHDGEIN